MRLNRLDLIRYGRFHEASLAFPTPAAGVPDVTLVHGPNEAGKSTAFNAFLELLYGMKAGGHRYAFRFERADLLIGAELVLPGRGPMTLLRNSKRNQSLTDAEGRPVAEAILSGALHGLGREAYLERFSLNDQGLREGGARIAGAQGDLGQLLHAGMSGLTSMSDTLATMTAQAESFYRRGARSGTLRMAKARLAEIAAELRTARLTPDREDQLAQTRDAAAAAFDQAEAALIRARNAQAAAEAAEIWHHESAEIARLEAALAPLPAGPDLPPGTAERVAALLATITLQEARAAESAAKAAHHERALDALPEDPAAGLLAQALARLDALRLDDAPLLARATTARTDLEHRRAELHALSTQATALGARLGLPPGADLGLSADALDALDAAAQAARAAAQKRHTLRAAHAEAQAKIAEQPAEPKDLSLLDKALQGYAARADLTREEERLAQARAQLGLAASALPADWAAHVAAGLPALETLDQISRKSAAAQSELTLAERDLAARRAEQGEAEALVQAARATPEATDAAQIEATRRARDTAWNAHRARLDAESAAAFEAALHTDDAARAHYLSGAEVRQSLHQAERSAALAAARSQTSCARVQAAAALLCDLRAEVAQRALALGLAPETVPEALAPRHAALTAAAAAAAAVATAEAALESAAAQRSAAAATLAAAAEAAGITATPEALAARAQEALLLQAPQRDAWARWQADVQALETLAQDVHAAEAAQIAADQALARLPAPLPARDAQAILAALPDLRALQRVTEKSEALTARIEALERAMDALAAGSAQLAQILESDPGADPLALIDAARARLAAARERARDRKEQAQAAAQWQGTLSEAQAAQRKAEGDLAAAFAHQEGGDLPPDERIAALGARDRLRAQMQAAKARRGAARDKVERELFAAELARLPDPGRAEALARALNEAQAGRDRARDDKVEAERLWRAAHAAAERDDLITEQAVVLEELREGARAAALAQLGVLAARGALRRLAAERRSSMLRDVEAAFVTMTAPAWRGVDVWTEAAGEKLVGLGPDGTPVPVEAMSTGTMGQLYFALRLAGYRSFAREAGPLPMILDDIMETFDDSRARAALSLCAGIGTVGQAILFTHHAHLVALARAQIPGVNVVEMPR
ncbi:AAA family ATPase [Rhodobacter lacus]|uniref:AAA family ATPase n=1 Tax=Rhodobacter lacus TaxID=1641972 RepID=A0ABW5ABA1_9RHOB